MYIKIRYVIKMILNAVVMYYTSMVWCMLGIHQTILLFFSYFVFFFSILVWLLIPYLSGFVCFELGLLLLLLLFFFGL